MPTKCVIKVSEYHDSVTLMETARQLTALPGVSDAAVVMATEANKGILRQAGLLLPAVGRASANDLVIVVEADSERAADRALAVADRYLAQRPSPAAAESDFRPRTVRGAARANPDANLVIISVPGEYAAGETWDALHSGLHVLLFSDSVSIEDEIALKRFAAEHGLLMMGPDCGTAIINGVALGFANVLPRGPVGIVAASGTGLQEVSTLLSKRSVGISQGIGTGGRDLKEAVGGTMMLEGVKVLQADPETEVLVLISKPPSPSVTERILEQARKSGKPTVVCFLGGDTRPIVGAGAIPASTLQEAAYLAAEESEGFEGPSASEVSQREDTDLKARASKLRRLLVPEQKYLRGLFSGGTLASETVIIWEGMLGEVRSNVPLNPEWRLVDATQSEDHCAVDLGADEFTVGRPHPMIDNRLRIRRLFEEASDPEVAAIVLDVVLGYGAHPDPTSELGPAISEARELAARDGRELLVISSVTGTEADPQGLGHQAKALEGAGAIVASCNATAARLAGFIVEPRPCRPDRKALSYATDKRRTISGRNAQQGRQESMSNRSIRSLFETPLKVLNVGLPSFAESLEAQDVLVTQVDWQPPLAPRLRATRAGIDIEAANREATDRIIGGRPTLVGMGIARDVIPGFHDRLILHAGPPVTWERMCGPQRGAVMGALVYEGLAEDEAGAAELAASDEIAFAPCHHYHSVGPMAGIVSPSMPVFVVENQVFGNVAYATQNEGLGKVLRYGAYGPEVYERLRWMEEVLYPTLKTAIESIDGGIDLRALISQALHMGDECHNRNRAGTSLFLRAVTPALIRTCPDQEPVAKVFEFIDDNDHFFLNLSMAAGKAVLEPAEGIEGSTVLTVMARNGTDFGIRMAGLPEQWFVAPAGRVDGLYLPGFSEEDANPDIGDSTVTETAGFGGFAMASAPAIARFVGGTPQEALEATREMYEICFTEHDHFTIPALNFRGTPLGIDVRKVAATGILPRLNTGIAHKEPGIGMVGAGMLRAPEACFAEAFEALRQLCS